MPEPTAQSAEVEVVPEVKPTVQTTEPIVEVVQQSTAVEPACSDLSTSFSVEQAILTAEKEINEAIESLLTPQQHIQAQQSTVTHTTEPT